jgi:simple sugar transport system permease protein
MMSFLIIGPLRDPATMNKPSTFPIGDANMVGNIGQSSVHWGLVYGLVVCIALWFLMKRTTFGFAVDISGGNIRAARMSGIPVGKLMVLTCLLGGAAAGLAGMIEVAAIHGRANTSLNAGYGYAGILVAFLARHNPLAIIPVALLLGGIRASSGLIQRAHDLPDATALVLQGIIFVAILASEMLYGRLGIFQKRRTIA